MLSHQKSKEIFINELKFFGNYLKSKEIFINELEFFGNYLFLEAWA